MMMAEGRIVTNEATGAQAWWDGEKLTPIRIEPGTQLSPADVGAAVAGRVESAPPAGVTAPPPQQPDEFQQLMRQGGERSLAEAKQVSGQLTRNVLVPLAQAGLGAATGGVSIPAQMLVGGAAEMGAQALGLAPESKGQVVAAAAIPGLGPLATSVFKGAAKATGRLFAPSATRMAAQEGAVESLGGIADVVKRAKVPKASDVAFAEVRKNVEEVPTNVISRGITNALNDMPKSAQSREATEYLTKLHQTFDAEASLPYENMAKEIYGMRTKASELARRGDLAGAKAVRDARQRALQEMEKISPDIVKANAVLKRETAISKIEDALASPRADIAFKKLVKSDKMLADLPEEDLRIAEKIAGQISKIGSVASPYSGVAAKGFNFFATPIAAMIESRAGRTFLRKMFKDEKVSPTALSTALQFWRAYEAQGGE